MEAGFFGAAVLATGFEVVAGALGLEVVAGAVGFAVVAGVAGFAVVAGATTVGFAGFLHTLTFLHFLLLPLPRRHLLMVVRPLAQTGKQVRLYVGLTQLDL